jgi:hypothetical protein
MCVRFIAVVMVRQECAHRHNLSITQSWCRLCISTVVIDSVTNE